MNSCFLVSGVIVCGFFVSVSAFDMEAFKKKVAAAAAAAQVAQQKNQAAAEAAYVLPAKYQWGKIVAKHQQAAKQAAELSALQEGNHLSIERRGKT